MVYMPKGGIDVVSELVAYYELALKDDNAHRRKWFRRRMRDQPKDVRDKVVERLRLRRHTVEPTWETPVGGAVMKHGAAPETTAKSSERVFWDDEEWEALAKSFWLCRKKDPGESILELVKRAQSGFPQHRKRSVNQIKLLDNMFKRVSKIDEELADGVGTEQSEQIARLEKDLEAAQELLGESGKGRVLAELTEAEVVERFAGRVLQALPPNEALAAFPSETLLSMIPDEEVLAHAVKLGVRWFMESRESKPLVQPAAKHAETPYKTAPTPQHHAPAKPKHPRVAVVGLLPVQQQSLEEKINGASKRCDFHFVDKNRDGNALPSKMDVVALAANFISHSHQDAAKRAVQGTGAKLLVVHGGVEGIARKIDEALR